MALSYVLRLVCLAVSCQILLQLVGEVAVWAFAPLLLRRLVSRTMRQRERLLYLAQVGPFLAAVLVTGLLCVPQYAWGETNLKAENVGWFCLAVTVAALGRFAAAFGFAAWSILRTQSFMRACKRLGTPVESTSGGAPAFLLRDAVGVALVGLRHPILLIAHDLLAERSFGGEALDVVLAHEHAHAAQRDNWKLLTLRTLPLFSGRLLSGRNWMDCSWMKLWQGAAELAADDDAVRADPARALLLAQSLVTVARSGGTRNRSLLQTSLTCGEPDLRERIDRLLGPRRRERQARSAAGRYGAVGMAASGALLLAYFFWNGSVLHTLAERLLHLG